jgi:hypothetical protein
MTLELAKPSRRIRRALGEEDLRLRDDELNGWLHGLENWVEGQLVATDALVRRTVNGRAAGKLNSSAS